MAKKTYVGLSSIARNVKKMYVGVNGIAHKVKKAYIGVNGIARLFYSAGAEFTGNWTQISVSDSYNRLAGHVRAGDYALFTGFRSNDIIVAIDSNLTVQYIESVSDGLTSGRFPFGYTDNYAMWASTSLGLAVNASLTQSTFTTSGLNISGQNGYAYSQDTGTYLKDKCIGVHGSSNYATLSIIYSTLSIQLVTISGLINYTESNMYGSDIAKCGNMYLIFRIMYENNYNTDRGDWTNSQIVISSSYTLVNQLEDDGDRVRGTIYPFIAKNLLELDTEQAIIFGSIVLKGDMYAASCCISRMDEFGTVRSYYPSVSMYQGFYMSNACAIIGKSNKICLISNNTVQGYGGASYYYLDTDTLDDTRQPWYAALLDGYAPSPNDNYYIWCNGSTDHGGEGNGPRHENSIMTCVQCM